MAIDSSMNHNLAVLLLTDWLLFPSDWLRRFLLAVLAHVHVLIPITFSLLFFDILVFTPTTFGFQIFTTSVGFLIFCFGFDAVRWTGSVVSTSHLLVLAVGLRGTILLKLFFELLFFCAISCAVIVDSVGFWLLRWKLSGCGFFRVPGT